MKNKRKLLGLTATASLLSLSAVLASCDKVKEYTVTFKNGDEVVTTTPVKDGYNVSVPTAPTSGDLEFNGWYKDAAKTTPFDFGSVITEDTTVYANWVNRYTVTFDTDGGTKVASETVREGGNVKVPTTPTKTNKVFAGWFKDQACTTAFDFGSVITKNTTVYAKWDLAEYNVSLYMPDGSLYKVVGVKDGELLEVGENPTINYKAFAGWYTDPSCTEDSVFDVEYDIIVEDIDLYAKFETDYETVTQGAGATAGLTTWAQVRANGGYPEGTADAVLTADLEVGPFTFVNNGKAKLTVKSSTECINTQGGIVRVTLSGEGTNNELHATGIWASSTTPGGIHLYKIAEDGTAELIKDRLDNGQGFSNNAAIDFDWTELEAGNYELRSEASVCYYKLYAVQKKAKSAPASIEVFGAKKQFKVGDEFETTGLGCKLGFENGSTETVKDFTVDTTAVDMTQEGVYTVTVNYTATDVYGSYPLSDTYTIEVYKVDSVEAFTYGLNSSRETVYNKLVYAVGDTLSTSGIYVHSKGSIGEGDAKVDYDDLLDASEWELANAVDMSTAGRKTVTLKYKKDATITTSFEIEVVEKLFTKDSQMVQLYVDASVEAATKINVDYIGQTYKFKSINDALQYLSLCGVQGSAYKNIIVAAGTYNEKVYINTPNVSIIGAAAAENMPAETQVGAGENCPVITFNNLNGQMAPNGITYSTDGAATFTISKNATNCTVCGVKIMNYYNTNELYKESLKITTNSQATACLVRGDMATFAWVTLSGYHDTLYADNGRQMYFNCDIEGRTDYIFGSDATAYFQGCTIRTIGAGLTEKNGGYVVATKGKAGMNFGYIFNECNFVADAATQAGSVSIARGWASDMTLVVMNSNLGAHLSKGTYKQGYYTKTVTADTFAGLVEIGLFTKNGDAWTKVLATDTFDASATYYVQLNDRYTKMNADPTASLILEYNNEGNGAIQYSAEAATKYAASTFTLLNPADTATQAKMARYEDMNTVFKAVNGTVKYSVNWNPLALLNQSVASIVRVNGLTVDNSEMANYKYVVSNAYVDNTLVDSQLDEIKSEVAKVLNDGFSIVGLYTDADYNNEFTEETVLAAETTIYVRIVEGSLEVVNLAEFQGVHQLATAEGVNADTMWTTSTDKDGEDQISTVAGSDAIKKGNTANDTYTLYQRSAFDTVIKSPKAADSTKVVFLTIYGGTTSTGESMQVAIKAHKADGTVVAETIGYTPSGKKCGYITTDSSADHTKEAKIKLKSTTDDISYVTVTLLNKKVNGDPVAATGTKQFAFASIKVSYEKIVDVVKVTKSLDVSAVSTTAYTADTLINDIFYCTAKAKKENAKIADTGYTVQVSLTGGKVQKNDDGTFSNGIKMVLTKSTTIKVVAGQKSDKSTKLAVIGTDGKAVTVSKLTHNGAAATAFATLSKTKDLDTYTFVLPAGTYYLGGEGGGAYIFELVATWIQ